MYYDKDYADKSDRFSKTPSWRIEILRITEKLKGIKKNALCLDLGCNTGLLLKHMSYVNTTIDMVGIDVNLAGLRMAKKNNPKATYYTDLDKVESNSVNYLVSMHCIPHLKDRYVMAYKLNRVMAEKGRASVVVNNKYNRWIRIIPNLFNSYKHDPTIVKDYSLKDLRKYMKLIGFVELESYAFDTHRNYGWFNFLAPRIYYYGVME